VIRFLLEFLRVDVTLVGMVNVSQAVSLGSSILALLVLIWRHRTAAGEYYSTIPGEEVPSPADR